MSVETTLMEVGPGITFASQVCEGVEEGSTIKVMLAPKTVAEMPAAISDALALIPVVKVAAAVLELSVAAIVYSIWTDKPPEGVMVKVRLWLALTVPTVSEGINETGPNGSVTFCGRAARDTEYGPGAARKLRLSVRMSWVWL